MCAAVTSVTAGRSEPFISGQSGKTSAEAVAVTLRSEQQQREGHRAGRERGEQREPLARAATADPRRVARPHGQVDQERDQGQGGGQVRRHRLPAVPEADRLAPEPRLEPDQPDGRERGPQDRAPVAVVADRHDRERQDLEADDDRDRPMDPFDPGLRVVERRDELAVAERPVGAAEPGIGGAHDDPDRDQPERGREGERSELLEAVHERVILPRRHLPTDLDTLSGDAPPTLLPLLAALALLAVACGSRVLPSAAALRLRRLGTAGHAADAHPGHGHERHHQRQGADLLPVPRLQERRASAPDRTAKVAFFDLASDPAKPVSTVDGAFVWTIENERGMYIVDVDFPTAGTWGAEFTTDAPTLPPRPSG